MQQSFRRAIFGSTARRVLLSLRKKLESEGSHSIRTEPGFCTDLTPPLAGASNSCSGSGTFPASIRPPALPFRDRNDLCLMNS